MKIALQLLVLCAIVAGSLHAQSGSPSDPKLGKWKLRVAEPASGTREYEDRGCGITLSTRQGVSADGRRYFSQYAAQFDGKDYPRVVRNSDVAKIDE